MTVFLLCMYMGLFGIKYITNLYVIMLIANFETWNWNSCLVWIIYKKELSKGCLYVLIIACYMLHALCASVSGKAVKNRFMLIRVKIVQSCILKMQTCETISGCSK